MKLLITGGHHTSALPVIGLLKKEHLDVEIFWVGHKHTSKGDKNPTLEFIDITKLNIPFFNLHAGKFYKTYDPIRLAKIPFGFVHALYLLLKIKPDMILSFGGYLAVPIVIVGKLLGIPSITHEQTVVVGLANKVISRFANKILISWPQSEKYFPTQKTVLTGLPLRAEIFNSTSNTFEINSNLHTVYITAGKTGSHKINTVIGEALPELLKFVNVIHQCGDNSVFNDFTLLEKRYEEIKSEAQGKYILRKFVLKDEIGEAFQKADFIFIRGGAHTVLEAIALKKPAIVVPIPWVSHNEQFKNAQVLNEVGLGYLIEEKNLTKATVLTAIKELESNINFYKLKDDRYHDLLNRDPAKLIVDEIFKNTKKKY